MRLVSIAALLLRYSPHSRLTLRLVCSYSVPVTNNILLTVSSTIRNCQLYATIFSFQGLQTGPLTGSNQIRPEE
jgi:hypothetical protein